LLSILAGISRLDSILDPIRDQVAFASVLAKLIFSYHWVHAMLLNSASALNRASGAFQWPRELLGTFESTVHGGPSARLTEARLALGPRSAVVFAFTKHIPQPPEGPM
jgi:hypothetical protein